MIKALSLAAALALLPMSAAVAGEVRGPSEDAIETAAAAFEARMEAFGARAEAISEDASLTAQLVADVQHGTLALAANGGFTYTPDANYCGGDGFTYRASDGTLTSSLASAAITVTCGNDPQDALFADGFED